MLRSCKIHKPKEANTIRLLEIRHINQKKGLRENLNKVLPFIIIQKRRGRKAQT